MILGKLPARLNVEQVSWVLNCQPHDVPILVVAKLLRPLGTPALNSIKYFAAAEILELSNDRTWLARFTNAIGQHWKEKNFQKNGLVPAAEKIGRFVKKDDSA